MAADDGGEPRFELVGDLAVAATATNEAEEHGATKASSSGRHVVVLEEHGVLVVSVENALKAWFVSQVHQDAAAHTKKIEGDRRRVGGSTSTCAEIEMMPPCCCLGATVGFSSETSNAVLVGRVDNTVSTVRVYAPPLSLVHEKSVRVDAQPVLIESLNASRVAVELANKTVVLLDSQTLSQITVLQGFACACRRGSLAVASGSSFVHFFSSEDDYRQPAKKIGAEKVEFYDDDDDDDENAASASDKRVSSIAWLDDEVVLCAYDKGTPVEIPDDIQCAVFNRDSGECVSQPSDLDDCVVPFAPTPFSKMHRLQVASVPQWRCALVVVNVAPDVKLVKADDEWDWHVHEAEDETTLTARTPNGPDGRETMVAGLAMAPYSESSKMFFLLSTSGILSCYRFTLAKNGDNQQQPFQPTPLPTKKPTIETATAGFAPPTPLSSSGFAGMPPMATRAPKPFGIATTVGSESAAATPPAPDNAITRTSSFGFGLAPTPLFAGNSPKTSENATRLKSTGPAAGFAGAPPMSKLAPKPFGAATESKSPGFSGIPPMAKSAPKPFGATPAPKPASGFAGIPPMSSTAPKPFGTAPAPAPSPAGFAGIPPMSESAPKPFGAPASKPASGFAGIPPMSSSAPKPFGTSTAPAPSSAGFAGIPPMSKSAPKPFGAPASKPASGFAGIPPMSSSAPKPFGTSTAPATSSAGFAGIPPMSKSAPKPFGAPASKPASGFAGIPPMSKKAPQPFGAPAPKPATGFAGNPPVSASAPKPFGAAPSPPATGGFAGIPPMSRSAPKPFGSGASASKPTTGFVPAVSPSGTSKPFGGATTSNLAGTTGFAGIPPTSKPAPKSSSFGVAPAPASTSAAVSKVPSKSSVGSSEITFGTSSAPKRIVEAVPRDEWEREKWKIMSEFDETLMATRTGLCAANEEIASVGATMDSKGESVRAALRSLTADFDAGEAGWRELTRTRAALLGNCEDVSRRVLDAEWSLNVTQGLHADSATDSAPSDSSNRARKAAAQWRRVLETRELDASSQARLDKLTSTSALVDAQLAQLSLVLKHRRALDDKICNKPSAASLIVSRRASSHGGAKKKADVATFFRRLRATYEAARTLHENTVPKLKERVDRLSSTAASTPRTRPRTFTGLLDDGGASTEYQEDKYEQQLSRLLASATKLTPTPRDERPFKLFWSPSTRGGGPGSSTTASSRLKPPVEAPPIALGDETLRGASSVLFSKWSEGKHDTPSVAHTTTPSKTTSLAATPIEKTPKTRLFGSTTKTEEEPVFGSALPQEFAFGQAKKSESPPTATKLSLSEGDAKVGGFSFGGGSSKDLIGKSTADASKEPSIFQTNPPSLAPTFKAPLGEKEEAPKSVQVVPDLDKKESEQQKSVFGNLSLDLPVVSTKIEDEKKQQSESVFTEKKAVPAPVVFGSDAAAPSPAAPTTPFGTEGKSLSRQESMIGGYQTQQQDPPIDYRAALVEIYQKHAPDKLGNVDKYLQKYKGREQELMAQLRKKYLSGGTTTTPFGGPAPAPASNSPFGQPFGDGSVSASSPFSSGTNIQASNAMAMTPAKSDAAPTKPLFGGQQMDPSGANNDMRDDSQQQRQQSSLFGGSAPQQNAFGGSTTTSSPFGSSSNAFGSTATPSPFGGAAQQAPPMGGGMFSGGMQPQGDIRSQVVAIYQRVDPSKLDKVDQFLAKYKGREAELLAQLNKKYAGKLGGIGGGGSAPASVFSGGGTTTAAFGAPTQLGSGAPAFSSQSQAPATTSSFASYGNLGAQFGSPSNLGASPFGSQPLPAQGGGGGSGFGSAFGATSTPGASAFGGGGGVGQTSSFGGTTTVSATNNTSPFGQPQSSPFGGQLPRQNSPFGGQQSSPFGAQRSQSTFGASPQQPFSSQPPSMFGGPVNPTTTTSSAGFGGFGGGQQQGGGGFGQASSGGFGQSSSFTQMRG